MLLSTLIMENLNLKPKSINKCISALSTDEQTFHESAPIYQNALRHSNFDHKLDYMTQPPHNAISFGLTLHSAKTLKQTSHAIFYA